MFRLACCAAALLLASTPLARAQVPAPVAPSQGEPDAAYRPAATAPVYFNPPAKYVLGAWISAVHWFEPRTGHDEEGMYINNVVLNGPANQKGIERGDIIVRINNQRITTLVEYKQALNASNGKVKIRVRDWRSGQYQDIDGVDLTAATPPVNPNDVP